MSISVQTSSTFLAAGSALSTSEENIHPIHADTLTDSPTSIADESFVASPSDKRRFTCFTHNLADIPSILQNSHIIVIPQTPRPKPRRQQSLTVLVKKLAAEIVTGGASRKKKIEVAVCSEVAVA